VTSFDRKTLADIQEPEIKAQEILWIDDTSLNGGSVLTY